MKSSDSAREPHLKKKIAVLLVLMVLLAGLIAVVLQMGENIHSSHLANDGNVKNNPPAVAMVHNGISNRYLQRHPLRSVSPEEILKLCVGKKSSSVSTLPPDGIYDSDSGVVYISTDLDRWASILLFAPGTSPKDHVIQHEYGHALLHDFLVSSYGGYQSYLGDVYATEVVDRGIDGITQPGSSKLPDFMYPSAIQVLILSYRLQSPDIYGDAYYTGNFHEFFAESYRRYLDGDGIPIEFSKFFDTMFVK
jgi:hypothetical protein